VATAVRAREAVGRVGRSRGGVGEEWRRENERGNERGGNSSAAARQRGGRGERGRGPGVGCHAARGVPWGLAPTGGRRPAVARARCSWATCAVRALPREIERGERRLMGGPAQCRVAVPLTGGSGLSAARGSAGCGRAHARGPAREEKEMGRPDAQ
jgi:hypothetical protein